MQYAFLFFFFTIIFSISHWDCIVIEDSVAGLTAALKAKMTPVAFVKYSKDYFLDDIKKLGIKNIFEDMRDVEKFILNNL